MQQKHHYRRSSSSRIWRTKWDNILIRGGEVSDDISSNINNGADSRKDTTQQDIKSIVRGGSTTNTDDKEEEVICQTDSEGSRFCLFPIQYTDLWQEL